MKLQDMSSFKNPPANWRIVGGVQAHLGKDKHFDVQKGSGILVNMPDKNAQGNLFSLLEHGDMDLELEFMMAKKSNSGIYLQGRYELQLLDSWGKQSPSFGDCAGIYERWDESKPKGQKGYQGHAPRTNTCRAPGLWQKLKISFQAPRFNANGQKVANARILEVYLNGILVQEGVELTGPTRGPAFAEEGPTGPLMIQGDHGPVAFRNIRYRNYDQEAVQLSDIKYEVYYGSQHHRKPNFDTLSPDLSGTSESLTWEVARRKNEYAIRFSGFVEVKQAGLYSFKLSGNENTSLSINGKELIEEGWNARTDTVRLKAGNIPFVLTYAKREGWMQPKLGLFVSGPGFRMAPMHIPSSYLLANPTRPIFLHVKQGPELMRCFVDYQAHPNAPKHRIVHALSAGHPEKLHYTYDLDEGALVQIWRGEFLDATPMWNSRGDGSSKALGSLLAIGDVPNIWQLPSPSTPWPDTLEAEAGFRFRGYRLDDEGLPTFHYQLYGLNVQDKLAPEDGGRKLSRWIKVEGDAPEQSRFLLARGSQIKSLGDGWFSVNDQEFYIQLANGAKADIRTVDKHQELLIRLNQNENIHYSVVF